MKSIDISQSQEILTVSRLNREVKYLLEDNFQTIWVEGEISNFSAPQSGHWYFCLKDPLAQVRCAMFKLQNKRLGFSLKDGMQVLLKARVSLYEGRGEFQLIVEFLEEAGEGKLRQEFEALKKRLAEAGLFDIAHKKPLPSIPKTIGIITSPTGAAIRDILHILSRRFSTANVIIYPTLVQGNTAAPNIVKAIEIANKRKECDVLIVTRGGGSLEDLWPFNEEKVAYAIYHSVIPIISGVGHEIDFTICDFVADQRAPTPSAAAELVTPDKEELLEHLEKDKKRLVNCIKQKVLQLKQTILWQDRHLQQQHPKRKLAEKAQLLDQYEASLISLQTKIMTAYTTRLTTLQAIIKGLTPYHRIHKYILQLSQQQKHLHLCMNKTVQFKQQALANFAAKLHAMSPLATLSRGYAIAETTDQHVLHSASEVKIGDKIKVRLKEGVLGCEVFSKNSN